ncbi:MAG: AAA family ATPase, partial [Anaerolineae bacterium]|nr:AAA family ATPase [Anaerolineae bacterium]
GRGVNLASRCMTAAPWGEIWVDEQVARRVTAPFELEWVGHLQFKGFAEELAVFRLSQRQLPEKILYKGDLIGREGELSQLASYIKPINKGLFAGTILIEGEMGMGKSRLVHTYQERIREDYKFFVFQCDPTQHMSFAAIRSFLRQYFQQWVENPTNPTNFMTKLRSLLDKVDAQLQSDLSLTYSCLGALIGLHWPDSHYEQLDPSGRLQNTLVGLKALIKAESLHQPVVIFIEDAHWMDNESRFFFEYLTRNIESYPIGIIVTTRGGEDVTRSFVGPLHHLSLAPLNLPGLAQLAEETLQKPASPELIQFLFSRAEGNPFIAEQILLYLEENELLIETEAGLFPSDEIDPEIMPVDVRAILTARLDSLPQDVRSVVQTASVLGREFEFLVLSQMLHEDHNLQQKVDIAAQASIWTALSHLQFVFKHGLLRETAYNMQLLSRRRELHSLAAESLEKLQAAGITPKFGELAYHYEFAGLPEKAVPYLEKAGDAAAYDYQNQQALDYYDHALALTSPENYITRFRLTLSQEKIFDLQGNRESQKTACDSLINLAQKTHNPLTQAEAALRLAFYNRAINNYPATVEAAEKCIALAGDKDPNLTASAHVRVGHALWLQGQYDESYQRLEQALELTQMDGYYDEKLTAEIWRNMGVVCWYKQDYDAAEFRYKQALSYCQSPDTRDIRGEAACLNNIGILNQYRGKLDVAIRYYQQSVEVYQMAGDRQGEGNTPSKFGVGWLLAEEIFL